MALNIDAAGKRTERVAHHYRWQDCVLYALGVGAKSAELPFLYEAKGPLVLPTYAVVPAFEVNRQLFDIVGGNLDGVVHGGQSIRLHAPIPASGVLYTVGEVRGLYDLKRMAQTLIHTETRTEDGTLVCETEWTLMYLLDGRFGGEPPPKTSRPRPPSREPDWTVEDTTTEEQALLYRLSGDLNPLHADPEAAAKAEKVTQGRPILHGLATYGYAGRALLAQECNHEPARLKSFSGRFSNPIWPGETIVTQGWREEEGIYLTAFAKDRPKKPIFNYGFAEIT